MSERKPKPYRTDGLGILNPDGDMWSPRYFATEREAWAYLEDFWRGTSINPREGFRVVPVRVTVSAKAPRP